MDGLGSLSPLAGAGGTSAAAAASATAASGRKAKAYGAKGKADRRVARKQARKMERNAMEQQQLKISKKKQQEAQLKESKDDDGSDDSDETNVANDNGMDSLARSSSGKKKKAGRSGGTGRATMTTDDGPSTLESLVQGGTAAEAATSPKRRQPSTKSAKSRGRSSSVAMSAAEQPEDVTNNDNDGNEAKEPEQSDDEPSELLDTHGNDRKANTTDDISGNDDQEGEEKDMDDMELDAEQPREEEDDDDDEDYVEEDQDIIDDHEANDDDDDANDDHVGSPPIQRTRPKPYARGRTKRTIEEEDDEENTVDSEDDEDVIAEMEDGPVDAMGELGEDGSVLKANDNDDEEDFDEEDFDQQQASLGGVLAATAATAKKGAPMLKTSPHRRSGANGSNGSSVRGGRGRTATGNTGTKHSHDAGDALASMQIHKDRGNKKEGLEAPAAEGSQTSTDSFFSTGDHLTDPAGDPTNGGMLTQGSDITDVVHHHNHSASKKVKKHQRVVESPYSTNSRLSDAESFQASIGSGKKEKAKAPKMKKRRRHYASDDDYDADTGSETEDQDRQHQNRRHRRRSSRQKEQRENSARYARGAETDDDEENEFVEDDDTDGANDTESGEEKLVVPSKSRRRRGGEGVKRRVGSSNITTNDATSDESDDDVTEDDVPKDDDVPTPAGKKRKESYADETPKADNRSLTQSGRDKLKEKKRRKRAAASASSSKNADAIANGGQEESLSFDCSQVEADAKKTKKISGSSRSNSKRNGNGGGKKRKAPKKAGPEASTDDDPFLEKDPSADVEREDPISEYEDSLGAGLVDSDNNEMDTSNHSENGLKAKADSAGTRSDFRSRESAKRGEAGGRRRRRLLENNEDPSFTSSSVLETNTKMHQPTIGWRDQVQIGDDAMDDDDNDTEPAPRKGKGRSGKARPSHGGGLDSLAQAKDAQVNDGSDASDDDDDIVGLKTQEEERRNYYDKALASSSESENDDDDDSDYQSSQVDRSGQQLRQKKRRTEGGKDAEVASALLATAANAPAENVSVDGGGGGKDRKGCRTPTKRVLSTITSKLRSLSRQTAQDQKAVTESLKKQSELFSELHQMRSKLLLEAQANGDSAHEFDSILKALENENETTVSTFASSLKYVLSATLNSDAKIDAEGRRKRLSALCTCLRYFVDVSDEPSATDIFNSFSRSGVSREVGRLVVSEPHIVSRLLVAVQCEEAIQKRSRPNEVEMKLRAQASLLSIACLSLVDPVLSVEQILSSLSSHTPPSTSVNSAVGDLHRLAASLGTMTSYPRVELSLLFLVRVRRMLFNASRGGANDSREKAAKTILKRLDKSFPPAVYREKLPRLNMHASSPHFGIGKGDGDGLSFCSWARECTKQGTEHCMTFGCKAVFNPKNNDVWGARVGEVDSIHINKSSLSFFVINAGTSDDDNTLRTTDSSITEDDTDGENASVITSARRDCLGIERLYGTSKLVEMRLEYWKERTTCSSGESAVDRPTAYIRGAGAVMIYLSSDGMKRSNLAGALGDKPQSNIIHIEIKKEEFDVFRSVLAGRGVEMVDDEIPSEHVGSQSSVTTAPYNGEELRDHVEFNTRKVSSRGVLLSRERSEQSDDEMFEEVDGASLGSKGLGDDNNGLLHADTDDEEEKNISSDLEYSSNEDKSSRRKLSKPSRGSTDTNASKLATSSKQQKSSLKRKSVHNENNDDDGKEDDFPPAEESGAATLKDGARHQNSKRLGAGQTSARATKKQKQQQQQQQQSRTAEKQKQTVRATSTREVTPLPGSNARERHDKQTSTSPLPHRSVPTKGAPQNLDTSFARVEQGMKKPLEAISARCCAMAVTSSGFNINHSLSQQDGEEGLADDVLAYDQALVQAVEALGNVRALAKRIEDGCRSSSSGSRNGDGYRNQAQKESSSSAFGWIDGPYQQVVENQRQWVEQRESVEKELSGILMNGLKQKE